MGGSKLTNTYTWSGSVVMQICSNTREVENSLDAELAENRLLPDARQLEQLGSLEGTAGHNDLTIDHDALDGALGGGRVLFIHVS